MTLETNLREARADELDTLIRLVHGIGILEADEVDTFATMIAGTIAGAMPGHRWFVLDGGALLGCAYAAPGEFQTDVWDLWFIGLVPGARRTGGGRRLVIAVEEAARAAGARMLIVETGGAAKFAGARAFYLALGYHEEARVRDYYAPGDDKVIYRRVF